MYYFCNISFEPHRVLCFEIRRNWRSMERCHSPTHFDICINRISHQLQCVCVHAKTPKRSIRCQTFRHILKSLFKYALFNNFPIYIFLNRVKQRRIVNLNYWHIVTCNFAGLELSISIFFNHKARNLPQIRMSAFAFYNWIFFKLVWKCASNSWHWKNCFLCPY